MDLAINVGRAEAQHDESCPEIGPICQIRNEPPQQHHTTLWLTELWLLGEYGLAPNWAVQASLPLRIIGTRTTYTDLSGHPIQLDYSNIHHRNETLVGLGDAQLQLHRAGTLSNFHWGGRVGVSLPTGKTEPNPYRLGALGLPHEHIQLGTGTFDPLLALDLTWVCGSWSVSAFGTSQLPLYQGPKGYRAGARIIGGAVVADAFSSFTARVGAIAYHEFPERWDGLVPTEDGNQGRTDVFLGPGITLPFAQDWSLSIDLRGRIYGHAVNAQLSFPVLLGISVGRLFHLEQGREETSVPPPEQPIDFADIATHGEATPLIAAKDRWTVFDFWAPWCEACKEVDRQLRDFASRSQMAIRRINIVDFDSPIARQELEGVTVLPHIRLVDPTGQKAWEGSGSPQELMREIQSRVPDGQ